MQKQGNDIKKASIVDVLHYVPKSMRKEGQSPFMKIKALSGITIALTKIATMKRTSSTLKGFIRLVERKKVKHGEFFDKGTREGFNPNANKLLEKAIPMMTINAKIQGDSKMQQNSRVDIECVQPPPV